MLWCSRTCKELVLRAPCIKYSIRSCSSCHTAAKNSQTNSSSVTWCGQHLEDTKSHMGNENYNFPSQCRAGALSECTLGSFQYLFHLMVELACIMVLLSVWVPCYPVSISFFFSLSQHYCPHTCLPAFSSLGSITVISWQSNVKSPLSAMMPLIKKAPFHPFWMRRCAKKIDASVRLKKRNCLPTPAAPSISPSLWTIEKMNLGHGGPSVTLCFSSRDFTNLCC